MLHHAAQSLLRRASTRFMFVAIALTLTQIHPATAAGELRFGLFAQGNLVTLDAKEVDQTTNTSTDVGGGMGGLGYGATFGYDWKLSHGSFFGLEMDLAVSDINLAKGEVVHDMNYLFSIRGRYGAPIGNGWIGYLTGGFAWLGLENIDRTPVQTEVLKNSESMFGAIVGFGAERDFHDMVIYSEYLFSGFREWRMSRGDLDYRTTATASQLRLGVKFKIGYDHAVHEDYYK